MNRVLAGRLERKGAGDLLAAPVLGAFLWAFMSSHAMAHGEGNVFNADTLTSIESVGAGLIDPRDRYFVFERVPPIKEWVSFSETFDPSASHRTGKIYVYALGSLGAPRPLFSQRRDTGYWIGKFSPDGNALYYFEDYRGTVRLCIYNFRSRRSIKLTATPALSTMFDILDRTPVWADPHTLVFTSTARGRPVEAEGRRLISGRLSEGWRKAWDGRSASVSVVSNLPRPEQAVEGAGALIRVNTSTGRTSTLLRGQFADLEVSASHRYLAALQEVGTRPYRPQRHVNNYWDRIQARLVVVDLQTGKALASARSVVAAPGSLRWAPGRDRLAYFGSVAGANGENNVLNVLDIMSGTMKPLITRGLILVSETEQGLNDRPVGILWLDKKVIVLARERAQIAASDTASDHSKSQATWFALSEADEPENLTPDLSDVSSTIASSTASDALIVARNGLWRIDLGRHELIMPNVRSKVSGTEQDLKGRSAEISSVLFQSSDLRSYSLVTAEGRKTIEFSLDKSARVKVVASAEDGSAIIVKESRGDGTSAINLIERDHGSIRERSLVSMNGMLSKVAPTRWTSVTYSVDRKSLTECVLLPAKYDKNVRYPLIVDVYPGRPSASPARCEEMPFIIPRDRAIFDSPYVLASAGYAVVLLAAPEQLEHGQDGPLANLPPLAHAGVTAVVKAGIADPSRVALWGYSQGGTATLWLAGHSNEFRAVVSINGWADFVSHYLSQTELGSVLPAVQPFADEVGRYEGSESTFSLGATLWERPEAYLSNSPILGAPTVTTPVMLVHSEMDAFPMQQYDEMYSALVREDKAAEYVRYWGETHVLTSPANIRDFWQRVLRWYQKQLS